jgi:hypothetical protein
MSAAVYGFVEFPEGKIHVPEPEHPFFRIPDGGTDQHITNGSTADDVLFKRR